MSCPLCACDEHRPSWLGALTYHGATYPYVECVECRSLYARPMPGPGALADMYGPGYEPGVSACHDVIDDPKEPGRVVRWLQSHPSGLFVDYGCGSGALLAAARDAKWRTIGVEFDADVAAATARRVGVPVADRFTVGEVFRNERADVLHLGDVIEHLTDPDRDMPRILALLKPGGHLIAQGPLEANATVFTTVLKLGRTLRGTRLSEMAPYHVLLATERGQRRFFERFGLEPVEFSMREVTWPAPSRLRAADLGRVRPVALFALRRVSQACTTMWPGRFGNRYFYIGHHSVAS